MTQELPENLRALDHQLLAAMGSYAAPADLNERIGAHVSGRSRLRLAPSPWVVKSAAAVVAIGLLGAFGYFANEQLNSTPSASLSNLKDIRSESFAYDSARENVDALTETRLSQMTRDAESQSDTEDSIRLPAESRTPAPVVGSRDIGVGGNLNGSLGIGNEVDTKSEAGGEGGGGSGGKDQLEKSLLSYDQKSSSVSHFKPGQLAQNALGDGVSKSRADKLDVGKTEVFDRSSSNGPAPVASPKPPAAPEAGASPTPVESTVVVRSQKVIRSGNVEFEVDSFDTSLMTITKLVIEQGGFVASTDSAKLSNGKMRGSITLRIPPERLDTFVLMLRGIGDLKSQKISAQDVSKQYTDVESGLKAARAMEDRLLEMIRTGQGAIKDLLAAEKELGLWREKIERYEGEKRYYDNLIGLSTLTVILQERDIKASSASIETETVSAGIETDDVDKARTDFLKAIDDAKGRVITSDLKKLDAGQFAATIVAEVPHDRAGPVIDRLKQLGKVARLDVDRRQTSVDGTSAPLPGAQIEKKPTTLSVSIYNLANVAPRLTTTATIASNDVETQFKLVMTQVEKIGGRVVNSSLQRPNANSVAATMQIEVPAAQAAEMSASLAGIGEVMNLQLNENPDTANVTTAKQGFVLRIVSAATVSPRETTTLQIASKDVVAAHRALFTMVTAADGRVLQSSVVEGDRDNITASLQVELPRTALDEWEKAQQQAGDVLTRQATRSQDTQNTLDSKVRLAISLYPADRLPPRQTTQATLRVDNAETTQQTFIGLADQLGGRVIDQNVSRDVNGRSSARVVMDIPRDTAAAIIQDLRTTGEIWSMNTSTNPQAPDGALSRTRFELQLAEADALIGKDAGIWSGITAGLSTSLRGLAWSVQLIVIGVCLVAPWVLIVWTGWKLTQRFKRKQATPVV